MSAGGRAWAPAGRGGRHSPHESAASAAIFPAAPRPPALAAGTVRQPRQSGPSQRRARGTPGRRRTAGGRAPPAEPRPALMRGGRPPWRECGAAGPKGAVPGSPRPSAPQGRLSQRPWARCSPGEGRFSADAIAARQLRPEEPRPAGQSGPRSSRRGRGWWERSHRSGGRGVHGGGVKRAVL